MAGGLHDDCGADCGRAGAAMKLRLLLRLWHDLWRDVREFCVRRLNDQGWYIAADQQRIRNLTKGGNSEDRRCVRPSRKL